MYASRTLATTCRAVTAKQSTANIYRAFITSTISPAAALKPAASLSLHTQWTITGTPRRAFSTTPAHRLKEFFPPPDAPNIKVTPSAWPHPLYTQEQMDAVCVAHREARNMSDKVALTMVKILRWGLDFASGYRHGKAEKLAKLDPEKAKKFEMNETRYMMRNVFLESVAGVPGMVAGMMRHLASMRRLERDNGWMETLLEESYNERMHLLTFLKMAEPGWFMRLLVLGAQGVMFNAFFLSYIISPRTCHRFVGYLEEEAVLTYTREIADLDAGKLPRWEKSPIPELAVQYWRMPEGKRTMRDLLMYIRADEAKHREVNHTLANLDQRKDPNPFVSAYKDDSKPHPGPGIKHLKPTGWERQECIGEV